MKIAGVVFAALFVVLRILAWPVISYHFWVDSTRLLSEGLAHSQVSSLT